MHYRARAYSPRQMRFLQNDPPVGRRAEHQYAYVGNNPVSVSDPDGQDPNNRQRIQADDPRLWWDPSTGMYSRFEMPDLMQAYDLYRNNPHWDPRKRQPHVIVELRPSQAQLRRMVEAAYGIAVPVDTDFSKMNELEFSAMVRGISKGAAYAELAVTTVVVVGGAIATESFVLGGGLARLLHLGVPGVVPAAANPRTQEALRKANDIIRGEALSVGQQAPQVIQGTFGKVSIDQLRAAASAGGSTTRVVTNLTRSPLAGRALSTATGSGAEKLAETARPGASVFSGNVPNALIDLLERAGLVHRSQTW